MRPKQPLRKSDSGSKDAGIVAYCHVCTIVHTEPVDQHCNLASPQDIAQFVLVNNLSVVDMGESSDSDIQSAQRQPSVTTEAPSSELPVTTGEDTTTTVVNNNSTNLLSADHDILSSIPAPFNAQQLHAMLTCQPTNVVQSPISTPNVQHVLQTTGPRHFMPLESPTQLRFTSQPHKRNVIYQLVNTKGQLLGTTTLPPSVIVTKPSTPTTVTPTLTHRIIPTQAASVGDRPQSPPLVVTSSATQPLSVSFTKPLTPNQDCRTKVQDLPSVSQSRPTAPAGAEAIPQSSFRHPLSSPEAYNQLLLSIRQTIRDETAACQPPQRATLPDVLEQDLQHRATRESLVQLMKQLTLQNEQRAKHHKHHKKGHPSKHKRSKSGSRRHKRQRSPQPFQPEPQPEPTTSRELTIQQINALLQAAKQEAKLTQPRNPDAPSQHNTNTQLSPHNANTTDSQEASLSALQRHKRKHKSSSSPTSTDSHTSARPLGMSKRKGHRHNKKHKRRHRHSSSSSSSYSSDSDTNSSRSSRIKSGAFRKYADRVSISFKWPNEFIGRTDGVSPTYQDLTFTEFMFGIVSGLLEQTPSLHQNRYLTDQLMYLKELFRDAMTTSLQDTMSCHRRVLEALEKGELDPTSWSQWNVR